MQLGFYFDQTRCTGCYTCCVACKDWHNIPPGRANWIKLGCLEEGTFPFLFVAYIFQSCFHCLDPRCRSACPVNAIWKAEATGIMRVDSEKCLGQASCGLCQEACPYGSPQFGDEENDRMQKCNFCIDRWMEGKKPICVEACPMRALDAGPLEELKAKYGTSQEGAGFTYFLEVKPSIIIKPKARNPFK